MNWYKISQNLDLDIEDELNVFFQRLRDEYPLSRLEGWIPQGRYIEIANIEVRPEYRGQGVGKIVLKRIQDYATEKGLPIMLSPEPERGRKKDLYRFYRSLGFKENRGRNIDYELFSPFSPTMFWRPIKNKL